MTPEKIIEMAKQAGMNKLPGKWDGWSCHLDELQAFAQLVRNAALEECAAICDQQNPPLEHQRLLSLYSAVFRGKKS
jgi:hypothetical protein